MCVCVSLNVISIRQVTGFATRTLLRFGHSKQVRRASDISSTKATRTIVQTKLDASVVDLGNGSRNADQIGRTNLFIEPDALSDSELVSLWRNMLLTKANVFSDGLEICVVNAFANVVDKGCSSGVHVVVSLNVISIRQVTGFATWFSQDSIQ